MQTVQFVTVDSDHIGQRLDNFLLARLKGLPKSHLYRVIRKGEVRVNKGRIKPDYRLQEGDIVRIPPLRLSAPKTDTPSEHLQKLITNTILYEDDGLLIINKPSGMAVHGGSGINFGVIETIRALRPQAKFLELVHRLDRDTSGCLLIAKKSSVLKELHELLRTGDIQKCYLALVQGYWPKHLHEVDAPLKKNILQSGERMVFVQNDGKQSLTEFNVVQRFSEVTLIQAKPKTGRTHQIRVHAQHAEHPVVGDEKYGEKKFNKHMRKLGCKRLFLHASQLIFTLPTSGKDISVKAELPEDLQKFLDKLNT